MNKDTKALSPRQEARLEKAMQASIESGKISMRIIGSNMGIGEERTRQLLNQYGMEKYLVIKNELSNRRKDQIRENIALGITADLDAGINKPLTFYVKKWGAKPELVKTAVKEAGIKLPKITRSKLELAIQEAEADGLRLNECTMKEIATYLKESGLGNYSLNHLRTHLHRYGWSYKKIHPTK